MNDADPIAKGAEQSWRRVGLLVVVALFAAWWLSDGPLESRPRGIEQRVAAVAIRDHVIPFQKFGTKLFTVPTLGGRYDHFAYITQDFHGDKRREFVEAIEHAASVADAVDLWILAHGNDFVFWLHDLSPAARGKLRLAYNTGCANAYQAQSWHRQGVRTYVGHPGETSVSPVFYVFFARRFVRGWNARDAMVDANAQTTRRLELFGWATLGMFDGTALAAASAGVVTGDDTVAVR